MQSNEIMFSSPYEERKEMHQFRQKHDEAWKKDTEILLIQENQNNDLLEGLGRTQLTLQALAEEQKRNKERDKLLQDLMAQVADLQANRTQP